MGILCSSHDVKAHIYGQLPPPPPQEFHTAPTQIRPKENICMDGSFTPLVDKVNGNLVGSRVYSLERKIIQLAERLVISKTS